MLTNNLKQNNMLIQKSTTGQSSRQLSVSVVMVEVNIVPVTLLLYMYIKAYAITYS